MAPPGNVKQPPRLTLVPQEPVSVTPARGTTPVASGAAVIGAGPALAPDGFIMSSSGSQVAADVAGMGGPAISRPEPSAAISGAIVVTESGAPQRFLTNTDTGEKFTIIGEPVAVGGQAIIYLVRDKDGHEFVAKVMKDPLTKSDEELARRFLTEAKILMTSRHPNLVRCLGAFVSQDSLGNNGHLTLILEKVEGDTLAEAILRGPRKEMEIVAVGNQVGDVLTFLAGGKLHHRDINPYNIMVRGTGDVFIRSNAVHSDTGELHATVIDLGVAKDALVERKRTRSHGVGTDEWAAPENFDANPVTLATDVYSLGLVLIAMALGEMRTKIIFIDPPEGSLARLKGSGQYSPQLVEALTKMTDRKPEVRLEGFKLLKQLGQVSTPALADHSVVAAADAAVASGAQMAGVVPETDVDRILAAVDGAGKFLGIRVPLVAKGKLEQMGVGLKDLSADMETLSREITNFLSKGGDRSFARIVQLLEKLKKYAVSMNMNDERLLVLGERDFQAAVARRYVKRLKKDAERSPHAARLLFLFHKLMPEVVPGEALAAIPVKWRVTRGMETEFVKAFFDSGNERIKIQVNDGFQREFAALDFNGWTQFLAYGATNVNIKNSRGETPLMIVVRDHHATPAVESTKTLLERGADISGAYGVSLLEIAVDKHRISDIAGLLIEKGVDVRGVAGFKALALAAQFGNIRTVLRLLEKGVEVKDMTGSSLLRIAAASNSINMMRLFIEHGAHDEAWGFLDKDAPTALAMAVKNNNAEMVQLLLEKGVRVEGRSGADMFACTRERCSLVGIHAGRKVLDWLGPYVNRDIKNHWEPAKAIIDLLIKKGFLNREGLKSDQGEEEVYGLLRLPYMGGLMAKILIENGASVANLPGDAIVYAASDSSLVRLLLAKREGPWDFARALEKAAGECCLDSIKELVKKDYWLNEEVYGRALAAAIENGREDVVSYFLSQEFLASLKGRKVYPNFKAPIDLAISRLYDESRYSGGRTKIYWGIISELFKIPSNFFFSWSDKREDFELRNVLGEMMRDNSFQELGPEVRQVIESGAEKARNYRKEIRRRINEDRKSRGEEPYSFDWKEHSSAELVKSWKERRKRAEGPK